MERTIGGKLAARAGESAACSRAIMWHLLVGVVSERAANDLLHVFNSHSCRIITATSPSITRLANMTGKKEPRGTLRRVRKPQPCALRLSAKPALGHERGVLMHHHPPVLDLCRVGSKNVNGGCRMTAWREGSATGPELNLSMSNQFFVRDAMDESVFVGTLPNVGIFCTKIDISRKNTESVGQRECESRSAPTYRVRKEAQSSTKQGSDPTKTRRTARCCVLLGGRGWGGTYGDAVLYSG